VRQIENEKNPEKGEMNKNASKIDGKANS